MTTETTGQGGVLRTIPVASIRPSPYQPRKAFSEAELRELADSIAASGLLQPIVVREQDVGAGHVYELIAGERRWRAHHRLGRDEIQAVVRACDDREAAALALVENLQRADLAPLEEARSLQRLMEEHGYSQVQLEKVTGIPRSTIGDRTRLLKLPTPWLALLEDGRLTVSQAIEVHRARKGSEAVHTAAVEKITRLAGTERLADVELSDFRGYLERAYPELAAKRKAKEAAREAATRPATREPAQESTTEATTEATEVPAAAVAGPAMPLVTYLLPLLKKAAVTLRVSLAGERIVVSVAAVPPAPGKAAIAAPRAFVGTAAEHDAELLERVATYVEEATKTKVARVAALAPAAAPETEPEEPRVNVKAASADELLRAYTWHLTRLTGGQVLFGNEILRRLAASGPAEPEHIVRDPHHNGADEWKLERGKFYQRLVGQRKWTEVKRFSATPARVMALASLVEQSRLAGSGRTVAGERDVPPAAALPDSAPQRPSDPIVAALVPAATCIDCGCDDQHACEDGCSWLAVDRAARIGVCSSCARDAQHAATRLDAHRRGLDTPLLAGATDAAEEPTEATTEPEAALAGATTGDE